MEPKPPCGRAESASQSRAVRKMTGTFRPGKRRSGMRSSRTRSLPAIRRCRPPIPSRYGKIGRTAGSPPRFAGDSLIVGKSLDSFPLFRVIIPCSATNFAVRFGLPSPGDGAGFGGPFAEFAEAYAARADLGCRSAAMIMSAFKSALCEASCPGRSGIAAGF
jgi:hypothetical protein